MNPSFLAIPFFKNENPGHFVALTWQGGLEEKIFKRRAIKNAIS
jgi:hypothetical protein